jgi:hypothetical protein
MSLSQLAIAPTFFVVSADANPSIEAASKSLGL